MKTQQKRIKILSKAEYAFFYNVPVFTEDERSFYFSLDEQEMKEMEILRSVSSRVYFILQLGYFKAKLKFFDSSFAECAADIAYILQAYFPDYLLDHQKNISQRTCFYIYSKILTLYSYSFLTEASKEQLHQNALESARVCIDPRSIFNNMLDFLGEHRLVMPGYSTLQACVSQALITEEKRLHALLEQKISPSSNDIVKKLLTQGDNDKVYGITVLKKDAQGFRYKEMMKEVEKKKASEELFKMAQCIIPLLDLSEQNICYYASLVDYYSVDRLKALSYENARLYILCYIYYRFEKIHDHLIDNFFYLIRGFKKHAKEYAKNAVYEHKSATNTYVHKIVDILDLFLDENIKDDISFGTIRDKVFTQFVPKDQFSSLMKHLHDQSFDELQFQWDYYLTIAKTITKNLRPLVCAIDFECDDPNDPLMKALTFIKQTFANKQSLKQKDFSLFPVAFIPASLQEYLYEEVEKNGLCQTILNVYQYEFLIYYQLANAMDLERFYVNTSFNYKSFQTDLLPDWEQNGETILTQLNNPILNTPIEDQLCVLEEVFNPLMLEVNHRIKKGENKAIHIKKKTVTLENGTTETITKWTLPYQKEEEEIDNPFYDQLPRISLHQALRFVNEKCSFLDAFNHIKPRYAKIKADEGSLLGCITAIAAGYSLLHMSEMSDISYKQLLSHHKNYIRLENLKEANANVVDAISELPIFKKWHLLDDKFLSSIDGQKILIRRPHWMARHSPKYFGQQRGVVLLSLIGNHACLNTKIISPNDYEGHHQFDVCFNNITHLHLDFLCGDTHSINQINFVLMRLLGCDFIPHIKNIREQANKISSFEAPRVYQADLIVPQAQFRKELIIEGWPEAQHILASLLMKKTTQSMIVLKISSTSRSSKAQRALWEYNKILHDTHILRIINDPHLRKSIRTALNRGEGYHQLTKKIAGINGNKLRGTTELELAISNECIRLIANCIIYYNSYMLSELYTMYEQSGDTEILEFIKRLSPVAWRHINLNGRYEFREVVDLLNIHEILKTIIFEVKKKSK